MAKSTKSVVAPSPVVVLTGLTAAQIKALLDTKKVAKATVIEFLVAKQAKTGLRTPSKNLLAELTGAAPVSKAPEVVKPPAPVKPEAVKPPAPVKPEAVKPVKPEAVKPAKADDLAAIIAAAVTAAVAPLVERILALEAARAPAAKVAPAKAAKTAAKA
jgi:hypothetical protein